MQKIFKIINEKENIEEVRGVVDSQKALQDLFQSAKDINQIEMTLFVLDKKILQRNKVLVKGMLLKFLEDKATDENRDELIKDVNHLINHYDL